MTIAKNIREDFLKSVFLEGAQYQLSLHNNNPGETGLNEITTLQLSGETRKDISFQYGLLNTNLQLVANNSCIFTSKSNTTFNVNWFCIWNGTELLWKQSISPFLSWKPETKLILSNIKIRY
jgi:hypothetical protein